MERRSFIKLYTWSIIAAGGAILLFSAYKLPLARLDARFLLLALITVALSSRLATKIPHLSSYITVSDTFIFLVMILFGGEAAILMAAGEGLCSSLGVNKKASTTLFNLAVMSLSTFLTVCVLRLGFGTIADLPAAGYSAHLIAAVCVMALAQYIFNSGLVAVLASLKINRQFWQTWKAHYLWTSITYFAGASAAGIIAILMNGVGFYAIIVATPIIVIIFFTYETYLKSIEVSQAKTEQAERHVAELSRHVAEQERISGALRESEEHFRSAFDHAAGMALIESSGRWLQVNDSLCEMLGYAEQDLLATSFQAITHREDLGSDLAHLHRLLENNTAARQMEKRYLHKSGREVWVLQSASVIRDCQDKTLRLILQIQDITERKRAEAALRESEERYRLLFESNPHPMWVYDLETLAFLAVNEAAILHYGYSRDEFLSMTVEDLRPDDETPTLLENLPKLTSGINGAGAWRHRKRDGAIIEVEITLHQLIFGSRDAELVLANDITERRRVEEQIHYAAFHDELTGLPNRTLLMDRLSVAVERARRSKDYQFAVLFLDLDRFKVINDSLGHTLGDQLLVEISRRLELCSRKIDTVARIGGDEFAILLDDIENWGAATYVAERIQKDMALPFDLNGHEISTAASIGIAFSSGKNGRPDEVLRDADTAMYRAKSNGKARYEVFDASMHARAVALLKLENDLRRAIERREIRVHYQPIISLVTKKIVGFEALARWQHPKHGCIPPSEFIPLAEETGLIVRLDMLVLREAWRQMGKWRQQFPEQSLTMNVNLSGKQFERADTFDRILKTLRETDLNPRFLCIEITETVLMENTQSATAAIKQLKAIDVQLSIDDFGTGYSSLSYLHRFPIDVLKIDRSFVNRMGIDRESSAIVDTIITLATRLGVKVVAEGVETEGQLALLKGSSCEYGQGYLFSEPRDADAIGILLQDIFRFPANPLTAGITSRSENEALSSRLTM